jgi:hypothetical protein
MIHGVLTLHLHASRALCERSVNKLWQHYGRDSSPVGRPGFKPGWGRYAFPGGFNSRSLPPGFFKAALAPMRHRGHRRRQSGACTFVTDMEQGNGP